MKKFIIGSALMLTIFALGINSVSAYNLSDAKAKVNGAQDKAELVWNHMNEIMDRTEAAGKDISSAEAYHADAEAKYEVLKTQIDELLAILDTDASITEKKAELSDVKSAFQEWKEVMIDIKDKLIEVHAAYPAVA